MTIIRSISLYRERSMRVHTCNLSSQSNKYLMLDVIMCNACTV